MRLFVTESIRGSRLSAPPESGSDLIWFGGHFEKCPRLVLYDEADIKRRVTVPLTPLVYQLLRWAALFYAPPSLIVMRVEEEGTSSWKIDVSHVVMISEPAGMGGLSLFYA